LCVIRFSNSQIRFSNSQIQRNALIAVMLSEQTCPAKRCSNGSLDQLLTQDTVACWGLAADDPAAASRAGSAFSTSTWTSVEFPMHSSSGYLRGRQGEHSMLAARRSLWGRPGPCGRLCTCDTLELFGTPSETSLKQKTESAD
jgi:hypothetical protein